MNLSHEETIQALKHGSLEDKIRTLDKMGIDTKLGPDEKFKICNQLGDMVHETVRFGRRPEKVSPLMRAILLAVLRLTSDPVALPYLTNGNLMLERLSGWINGEMREQDLEILLLTMEKLTQNLVLIWKPPFIQTIITHGFDVILHKPIDNICFIYSAQIFINLCRESPVCQLTARSEPHFKEIWKFLSEIVYKNTEFSQGTLLATHLMFVLESGPNTELLNWGFSHANSFAKALFLEYSNSTNKSPKPTRRSCAEDLRLLELTRFMATLMKQVKLRISACCVKLDEGCSQGDLGIPAKLQKEGSTCRKLVLGLTEAVLLQINDIVNLVTDVEQRKTLLLLITTLTPEFLTLNETKDSVTRAFVLVRRLLKGKDTIPNEILLKTFLHLVTKVVGADGDYAGDFEHDLKYVMASASLIDSTAETDTLSNISCCRIFTQLRRVPNFSPMLDLKLQDNAVTNILSKYMRCKEGEFKMLEIADICCIVETLGVLADNSQNPKVLNTLIEYLNKPVTSQQIAAAILSGDDKLVKRALSITSCVAFSKNSLNLVVNSLVNLTEGVGCVVPVSVNSSKFSPQAAEGLEKLEETLEAFSMAAATQYGNNGMARADEIISLFELKNSIHETEKQGLRDQLNEVVRAAEQLKLLLKKQSEMLAQRMAAVELKNTTMVSQDLTIKECNKVLQEMKEQLENEAKQSFRIHNFTKARLEETADELKAAGARIAELEKENKESKAREKALEKEKAAAKKQLDQLTADTKKRDKDCKESRQKAAALERELRQKEEERERLELLLEKEKRTVDMIRGLLGNNIGI